MNEWIQHRNCTKVNAQRQKWSTGFYPCLFCSKLRFSPSLTPNSCFEARRDTGAKWWDYLEFFLAKIPSGTCCLLCLLSDPLYWSTDKTLQPLSSAPQGLWKGKVWLQMNMVRLLLLPVLISNLNLIWFHFKLPLYSRLFNVRFIISAYLLRDIVHFLVV